MFSVQTVTKKEEIVVLNTRADVRATYRIYAVCPAHSVFASHPVYVDVSKEAFDKINVGDKLDGAWKAE
jgi:predicted metallopeptidase